MATPKLAFKPLKKKPVRKAPDFFLSQKKKKKSPAIAVNAAKNKKKVPGKDSTAVIKGEVKGKSILEIQKSKVAQIAKAQKKHDPPTQKVEETQKAVSILPALEKSSKAKSNQVTDMASQKPKKFDAVKFSDEILSNIKTVIPKDPAEMEKDKTSSEKMGKAQQNITDTLEQEKHNAGGDISASAAATPDESGIAVKETAPLPPESIGAAPTLPGAGFAPPLKTTKDTDLSADSKKIDNELANNNVSEKQLQNANEPGFSQGLADKKASQANAAQTHQQYLAQAAPTVNATTKGTQSLIAGGLSGMFVKRNKQLSAVDKNKELKKQQEEKVRQDVANDLNKIYADTKTKVDAILDNLKKNVDTIFDTALANANKTFEENVDRRTDVSWFEKIANWAAGIPDDTKTIFKEEQDNFINYLNPIVVRIGQLVEGELTKAANETEAGRKATSDYWARQSDETKKIAGDIFEGATDKFNELDAQIEASSNSLKESITTKFNEAVSKLQETFDKIKEANKSWLERAYDAVVGIIKAIIEMKNLLLNVLKKAANVIGQIITDPIGFLSNLLDAVVLGFKNFGKNALEHLKRGFFEWLMGNMPPSIKFPKQWDLKGILEFVMSVLGLTWDNIKLRATKMFGPKIVAALETGFEIFMIIRKDGLGGLWEYIKEKIGNLKEMAVDAVQNMLIDSVIKAGITWVIGLFNPVGAFIKACKLIYDVISWFINNARKILALINSIIDSTALIVAGKITQAAQYVEDSIAKAVPIGIAFLAGLLGLGDLSKKVQALLDKIRAPIDKAIDWVLEQAGKAVKGLIKAGKAGAQKLMQWLGMSKPFKFGKESHTLLFKENNGNPEFTVQSYPIKYNTFIKKVNFEPKEKKKEAMALGDVIDTKLEKYKGESEDDKRKKWADDITKDINTIAKIIEDHAVTGDSEEKVPSIITYKGTNAFGLGMGIEAKNLTMNNVIGQETNEDGDDGSLTESYAVIKQNKNGDRTKYVRGHLLNAKLGGVVNNTNLTPLTGRANKSHLNFVEKAAKKIVTGKRSENDTQSTMGIAYYKVDVIYGAHPRNLSAKYIEQEKRSKEPNSNIKFTEADEKKKNIAIMEEKVGVVPRAMTVLLKKMHIVDKKVVDDTSFQPIEGSVLNNLPETVDL